MTKLHFIAYISRGPQFAGTSNSLPKPISHNLTGVDTIKPITCGQCKKCVGWYDTKYYNIVKPVMPAGVTVIAAFLECECGSRFKFNGMEVKKREIKKRNRDQDCDRIAA